MSVLPRDLNAPRPTSPPRSIWRNVDFLILWWGQVVSSVGTQASNLAFPLLVLAVTRSPAQAGIVTALRTVPYIFLTLPAGALVDRWDRKRVMILSDAGRAVVFAGIPAALATGHLTLAQLAISTLVEGTLFTFFNVAETACLPQVLVKEELPGAIAVTSITDHTAGLAGPSIGGALYGIGRAVPFLTDAISYAVSVISLLFITVDLQEERAAPTAAIWREIHEGLLWLWRHPTLRTIALGIGGLNLFSMGYPLIMIVRAQELHAGSFAIGLLFAAGGLGGILGSAIAPRLQRRFGTGRVIIGAAWFWALTWIPYALAPTLFLLGVANVAGWIVIPVMMITQLSYRLTVTPDELQGRVGAVFKLIAFGSQPIALALAGLLLQLYGAVPTILITLVPQLVLAGLITLSRELHK